MQPIAALKTLRGNCCSIFYQGFTPSDAAVMLGWKSLFYQRLEEGKVSPSMLDKRDVQRLSILYQVTPQKIREAIDQDHKAWKRNQIPRTPEEASDVSDALLEYCERLEAFRDGLSQEAARANLESPRKFEG